MTVQPDELKMWIFSLFYQDDLIFSGSL